MCTGYRRLRPGRLGLSPPSKPTFIGKTLRQRWKLAGVCAPGGTLLLACETAKLPYYLKEYADNAAMEAAAQRAGFAAVQTHRLGGWVCFVVQK